MVSSKKAPQTAGLEDSLTLITVGASFLLPSLRAEKSKHVALRDFPDFILFFAC